MGLGSLGDSVGLRGCGMGDVWGWASLGAVWDWERGVL